MTGGDIQIDIDGGEFLTPGTTVSGMVRVRVFEPFYSNKL